MPTYEYQCDACGHAFEKFQPMSADPVKDCPKCGKPQVRRLISAGAGLIFKGSGFYITDYRDSGYKDKAKADAASSSASSGGDKKDGGSKESGGSKDSSSTPSTSGGDSSSSKSSSESKPAASSESKPSSPPPPPSPKAD